MRYELLISRFLSTPWALDRTMLSTMATILTRRAFTPGKAMDDDYDPGVQAARQARQQSSNVLGGGIAVVPVYGVIMQRADMLSEMSGATSTQNVSSALQAALADETVSSILLDIDSPGGSVFGVQELADEIQAANAKKPVTAIANSLAASAAYWLGSQASEFHVTPSGMVGSIGVYAAHDDYSKALEDAGIKTTLVSAGKFKTEGNPYEPLSPEGRDYMQSQIDGYYQAFTAGVARGRSAPIADVRSNMGQGRTLMASDAKAANMVDSVSSYAQVVKNLQKRGSAAAASRARARARSIDLIAV